MVTFVVWKCFFSVNKMPIFREAFVYCFVLLSGGVLSFFVPGWLMAAPTEESAQWLAAHNQYRKLHGVPSVVWSEKVAASALVHAKTCPSGHSGSRYGENLAWASYDMGIGPAVKMWYDEEALYDYENPGYIPGVGHFTQVVWKATQEIGCAHISGCRSGKSLRANIWVCHYFPPGNFHHHFQKNVLSPLVER